MADSIYPDIDVPELQAASPAPTDLGRELKFDFGAGEFVGGGSPQVVEGVEALTVWIEKALRTARYRYVAYTPNYGSELEAFVEKQPPLTQALLEVEVERLIREAIGYDNRIKELRNFQIVRGSDWLDIGFEVVTILGEVAPMGVRWIDV